MSRSLDKEIISTSCILLILLLSQLVCINICHAELKIDTDKTIIVIDPGHGGEDTGITINSNFHEKDLTLKLGKLTASLLENKYIVLLTRQRDLPLSVVQRTAYANRQKANIFISLHAKAKKNSSSSIIIFKPPLSDQTSKSDPSAPWKTEQLKHIKNSKIAAKVFSTNFKKKFNTDFHIVELPALVLQGAQMPAVLIEVLSMEDLWEEKNIETILQDYARIIARSLEKILQ